MLKIQFTKFIVIYIALCLCWIGAASLVSFERIKQTDAIERGDVQAMELEFRNVSSSLPFLIPYGFLVVYSFVRLFGLHGRPLSWFEKLIVLGFTLPFFNDLVYFVLTQY